MASNHLAGVSNEHCDDDIKYFNRIVQEAKRSIVWLLVVVFQV